MCHSPSVCLHSDAPHLVINPANPALIMSHASSSTQTQSEQIKSPFSSNWIIDCMGGSLEMRLCVCLGISIYISVCGWVGGWVRGREREKESVSIVWILVCVGAASEGLKEWSIRLPHSWDRVASSVWHVLLMRSELILIDVHWDFHYFARPIIPDVKLVANCPFLF